MANQSTSPHEAAVARRKLEALGVSAKPPLRRSHRTPPRPSYRASNTRGGTFDFNGSMEDWLRRMFDQSANSYQQANARAEEFREQARRANEAMAQAAKAAEERRAKERRLWAFEQRKKEVRADAFCPRCMHNAEHHVGPRCYACHPSFQIEAAERRADWCGRIPFELGGDVASFHIEWGQIETATWKEGGS